ncbi:MAG: GNAT family N-acetyltransferase [Moritella sp.]|uniref:GNAT family N-acetyltransferase n=1 Tax=unclassified Moritella TaxID=2637987 RepID=UPI0001568B76|nr:MULTISPECIES: GNAT family N-acetyltransferase [unclassified Moritella]EDM65360.1 acetyltransferase, GNAT family [Moritella sp. PE36]MBL1415930.1 GNAT family N-acetyltransferase [Moritella sp.]
MDKDYIISANFADMDLAVIHGFISTSYWAKGIPVATLQRALENSLCFGVFTQDGKQVGFARMITDKATFAYLADVFVLEAHQGKGLSKLLMAAILDHPELQGLRRMVLATSDAHGLYQQFGFTALAAPEVYMELHTPYLYE